MRPVISKQQQKDGAGDVTIMSPDDVSSLSVVTRTIERELSTMQKRGFIIHEGNTSAGRWVVLRQS